MYLESKHCVAQFLSPLGQSLAYLANYHESFQNDSRLKYKFFCGEQCSKTRMTTFIKTKFNISDDQTNIDKYRLAANITEYHIISKLIFQRILIINFCGLESHVR